MYTTNAIMSIISAIECQYIIAKPGWNKIKLHLLLLLGYTTHVNSIESWIILDNLLMGE